MLPVLKSSWMLFQLCICEAALLQIEMFFFSENWKMYAVNQKDCMDSTKENERKELVLNSWTSAASPFFCFAAVIYGRDGVVGVVSEM